MATHPRYAVAADPYEDDLDEEYDSAYESPQCAPCEEEFYEDEGYAEDPSARYEDHEVFTEHEFSDRSDPTPRAVAELSEESYRTASELFSDRSDPTPRAEPGKHDAAPEEPEEQHADEDQQTDPAAIYHAPQPDEAAPLPAMNPCAICNRKFALDRLPRHEQACRRTSEMQKKRKAFDPRAQRWQGDADAEQFVKHAAKRGELDKPDPEALASQREAKRKKWQRQSLQIRRAAAAAKDGGAVPAPMLEEAEADDRVPCPHCGRKFAALPAERHIAKCKDIRAKPQTIKRSQTSTAPMMKQVSPREEAPAPLPAATKAKVPAVKAGGKKPAAKRPAADAAGSVPSADPPAVEAGAARMAERIAGRSSPVERLAGRNSPVPALDFTKLGGSHKPAPAEPSSASGAEATEPPKLMPPPSLEHSELPPPPPELDQLHALGDAKFGKHNTRRPAPVAQPKRRSGAPAAAAAPAKGWDASPPVQPPPGRKPKQSIGDVVAEDASAKPAAKKPARSSGYGQARPAPPRRSVSGASSSGSASGGSARSDSPQRAVAAQKQPAARRASAASRSASPVAATGTGSSIINSSPASNRSSCGSNTSSRPASRNASPVGKRVQCTPGMRPPTVPRKPGQAAAAARGSPARRSPPTAAAQPAGGSTRSAGSNRSDTGNSRTASPPPAKKPPRPPRADSSPVARQPVARQPMAPRSNNSQNIESGVQEGASPLMTTKPHCGPSNANAADPGAPPPAGVPFFHPRAEGAAADLSACLSPSAFDVHATAALPPRQSAVGATLFDRPSSVASTPRRRTSFAAAEVKQNAEVSYKEVRIERFGWRRNSFISRADSPMLVR